MLPQSWIMALGYYFAQLNKYVLHKAENKKRSILLYKNCGLKMEKIYLWCCCYLAIGLWDMVSHPRPASKELTYVDQAVLRLSNLSTLAPYVLGLQTGNTRSGWNYFTMNDFSLPPSSVREHLSALQETMGLIHGIAKQTNKIWAGQMA